LGYYESSPIPKKEKDFSNVISQPSQRNLDPANQKDAWFAARLALMTERPGQWSLYFKNLQSSYTYGFNSDISMDSMSVIKIPLLMTLLKKVDEGVVDLRQEVLLTNSRKRFGTGILASMDVGHVLTIKDAATLMMALSDNTATDILFEIVGGPTEVNSAMSKLGFDKVSVVGTSFDWFKSLATSIDPRAATYSPEELFLKGFGIKDKTELHRARSSFHFSSAPAFSLASSGAIGGLLELLVAGKFVSEVVSAAALAYLNLQSGGSRIPRYLPPDSLVYHTSGDFNPFIANDAAVVRKSDGNQFILCIFSSGNTGNWGDNEEVIARIAQDCYFELDKIT
jgi:beta-lactamase class A